MYSAEWGKKTIKLLAENVSKELETGNFRWRTVTQLKRGKLHGNNTKLPLNPALNIIYLINTNNGNS